MPGKRKRNVVKASKASKAKIAEAEYLSEEQLKQFLYNEISAIVTFFGDLTIIGSITKSTPLFPDDIKGFADPNTGRFGQFKKVDKKVVFVPSTAKNDGNVVCSTKNAGHGIGTHWVCWKWKKGDKQAVIHDSYKKGFQADKTHGLCFGFAMMEHQNATAGLVPFSLEHNAEIVLRWLLKHEHEWSGYEVGRAHGWVRGDDTAKKIRWLLDHKYKACMLESLAWQGDIKKLY